MLHQTELQALALAVDALADVRAKIAELQKTEKDLSAHLKGSGYERITGTLHEARVVLSERESLDVKALRADLGEEIIQPYLRRTDVVSLMLTARKI